MSSLPLLTFIAILWCLVSRSVSVYKPMPLGPGENYKIPLSISLQTMSIEHWTLDDAHNMKNVRLIYFVCNAAWTWDVISSASSEVNMLIGRRIVLVDIVYIFSRVFTGLTIYATFPFIALPAEDCNTLIRIISCLGGISGSLTTLLFLFRMNSVYYDCAPAKIYFGCLWVLAGIGHLIFPLSLSSQSVQLDALCIVTSIRRYGFASAFVVATFDWTAYLSISFRVIQAYAPDTRWREKCKMFITGTGIRAVSRIILLTGHFYIMPLLCFHIVVLWAEFSPALEPPASYQYQAIFMMATIVTMNSMACRIFRLLREHKVEEEIPQLIQMSTIQLG